MSSKVTPKRRKPRGNEDLFDMSMMGFDKSKHVFSSSMQFAKHDIYITQPLEKPDDWLEEINLIYSSGPNDQVHLHILTPGGDLGVATLFYDALMTTEAMTFAHIGSECASAGTMIALACKEFIINPFSSFMIHSASHGYSGKEVDVKGYVEFFNKQHEVIIREIYSGFLSEEEIFNVLNGREYWFVAEDLSNRLAKYQQFRIDNMKKLQEEEQKQIEVHEDEEEVEFDDGDPSTWPEDTVVVFNKAFAGIKKGSKGVLESFVETSIGDALEIVTEDGGYVLVGPNNYDVLKFAGELQDN